MADWWDKYQDQPAPLAAAAPATAPAGDWWDKYADQPRPGGSPAVPGMNAIMGYAAKVADQPSPWDSIGQAFVPPGVPSGDPANAPPPAPPTMQFDLPSAVRGLQEMENAADPGLGGRYVGAPVDMTPERETRVDRLKQLGWASVLNQTDNGLWDSIRAIYPDAQMYHDTVPNPEFPDDPTKATHNPVVVVNGQAYYLNRPGIDATDVARYGPSALLGVGIGGAAGGVARGLIPRMALVGAGEAGLSAALDASAQWTGSEQPISGGRMGAAAVGGAAGELVGAVLGGLLRRYGSSAVRTTVNPATGQPTLQWSPEAQAAIQAMNIDPTALSQAWIAQFQRTAQRTLAPDEAARLADLTTLPTPLPYSRGDITRLPSDQMTEDLMKKGAYGGWAQGQFRTLREGQQAGLAANADEIGRRIGGGVVTEPGLGGTLMSNTLTRLRDQMKARTDALYDAARASATGGLDVQTTRGLAFDLASTPAVAERMGFAPDTKALLDELQGMITSAGDGEVTIKTLFDWRRRVTTMSADTANRTDRTALSSMVRTFDEKMRQMVEANLFRGDDSSVQAFADAIGSRRELGRLFEGGDLIEDLTRLEPHSGRLQLAVPPEQAANAIFGLEGLGVGRIDLARDLARIRDILTGPTVATEAARAEGLTAWNALREEAFRRLIRRSEGPYALSNADRSFSGANLSRAVDSMMQQNPQLMRVLFSPEELAQIQQLKRAANAVTIPVPGGQNFSNTGPAVARMFQDMLAAPLRKIGGAMFGPNSLMGAMPGIGPATAGIVGGARAGGRIGRSVVTQPMGIAGWLGGIAGSPALTPEVQAQLDALKARQAQSGQ